MTMNYTIQLRALRGLTATPATQERPTFSQHPKGIDATTIDLAMHWPAGVPVGALKVAQVRCNGVALKHRQDGDQVTVSPMLRLEGERIEVDMLMQAPGSPVEATQGPTRHHPTRKPLRPAPAPVYGFTPRGAAA